MDVNRYLYIGFLILACNFLQAQTPSFKHFGNKEGLVQSPISCIVQDKIGLIWLATQKGLIRYDGYEFKVYHRIVNDSTTISNNKVNVIFEDSEGLLWIGTSNGLNLYNQRLGTFKRIDVGDIKGGKNYISSIVEDHQKNIWIGTFGGLKKLDKKTLKLKDIVHDANNSKFKSSHIFSLLVDHENTIWTGTDIGLVKFDPMHQKILALPSAFDQVAKFLDNRILIIKQDVNQELYFGTEVAGVFRYNKINNSIRNYLYEGQRSSIASNWVKDILFYEGKVWFATRDGLSVLDKNTHNFSNYKHDALNDKSLNDNSIWSLLKDKNNCIWVGTFAGGLNFYYSGNSNFLNIGEKVGKPIGLNHVQVKAITQDDNGSIWVGTAGGLNHVNLKANISLSYNIHLKDNPQLFSGVKSMADDGKGNLWVGTLNGVCLFNKKSKRLRYIDMNAPHQKLSENLITALLTDGNGAWVGTNGAGLRYVMADRKSPILLSKSSLPGTSNSASSMETSLSDNYITALWKDGTDSLWIGTQNGLNLYDTKANKIIGVYQKQGDRKYQLSKSNISALFKDTKQRLWIGTDDGGLNYFDARTQRFYSIDHQQGLNDDVIHAIVEDNDHNIWVSTDLGLSKIKFKAFELPFRKEALIITSYTVDDGLISNQFSNQAVLKSVDGEIIFGGINGLTIFHPEKIKKNTTPPPIVITELLVNNAPLKSEVDGFCIWDSPSGIKNLELNHDQSTLGIKFAALNYINSYNNNYAYVLEGSGLTSNWQMIDHQRIVNFTNLRPGHYVFKVKAANNDGVWAKEFKSIKIYIRPPLWFTWWAYLIYFAIAGVTAYVIFSFIRNKERLKRDLYLEHTHNEKLNQLYDMKLSFFTNISHEIRTPLTLILGPIEKLINEHQHSDFSKALLLIKKNADRLMKLVTELLDFRKAEEGHLKIFCKCEDIVPFCYQIYESFESLAASKNITFNFLAPPLPILIYFDANQLEKVIFNLLANSFKFTPMDGEISLSITNSPDGDWVEIAVADNGCGFSADFKDQLFESFAQANVIGNEQTGSGIGLAMAKHIVELHKGRIEGTSYQATENYTRFTVYLQTGNQHLPSAAIFAPITAIPNPPTVTPSLPKADELFATPSLLGDKKYKVMVVEDNLEVRELIVECLQVGYQVMSCADGQVALALLKEEIPDLIVSDIMMPYVNGIELCEKVKRSEATNHIPFILLTAKASVEHQLEGLGTGADVYLSKPFSIRLLQLNIKNLLKAQEVVRVKFGKSISFSTTVTPAVTPEEKFIEKLMSIIDKRMDDASFDVLDIVNEIGMSRSVLYKKVQQLTNYAVADLIKEVRLKKAAQLLQETSFNVSEITYMIGFNNRKHFSKEFKKKYKVNPSEFAKEHKLMVKY
jgi:ligand-binding sensor domain-containing protein/signal transduction histidine kinase/DNA-binding response OmpR family regulator